MSVELASRATDARTARSGSPDERLGAIHGRLRELAGQLNDVHAEISRLTAEVDRDELLGGTGLRSVGQWLEWQLGLSPGAAAQVATIARRRAELPEITAAFDAGHLSVDQVGAVARRAPAAHDEHYAELAPTMTVRQLRKAVSTVAPSSEPDAGSDGPRREIRHGFDDEGGWFLAIRTDAATGAAFDAGLRSHFDALLTEHRAARVEMTAAERAAACPPTWFDAFERLVEGSLSAETAARPWNARTKVVVHLEADRAALHLGPALTAAERALLTCDASIQTVLTRFGTPVNVGREHRITPPATRLVVEARDCGCRHPLCRRSGALVLHHLLHWEDGGPTDTANLVCLCPAHHRAVHRGDVQIRGNPDLDGDLRFFDRRGRSLEPPAPSPPVASPAPSTAYRHPIGEKMRWHEYAPPDWPGPTSN